MCWAAGCQDRSVSLWLAHEIRPVFVMEELFTDSVTDLSLRCSASGGLEIVACSQDGTVKCLLLTKQEIGNLQIDPLQFNSTAPAAERLATPVPRTTASNVPINATAAAVEAAGATTDAGQVKRRRIVTDFVPLQD